MHWALQFALFAASIAIVVFVIVFLVAFAQLRKNLEQTVKALEQLKSDVKLLVEDTRKLLANVNALTDRTHRQWDDLERVIGTVRGWSERANRVVEEVGSALEPPLLTAARNINLFRTGFAAFLQALLHRNQPNQQKEEESHG